MGGGRQGVRRESGLTPTTTCDEQTPRRHTPRREVACPAHTTSKDHAVARIGNGAAARGGDTDSARPQVLVRERHGATQRSSREGRGSKARCAAHGIAMDKCRNGTDRLRRARPFGLGRGRAISRPSHLHGQPAPAASQGPEPIPTAPPRGTQSALSPPHHVVPFRSAASEHIDERRGALAQRDRVTLLAVGPRRWRLIAISILR